jgi:hypothetical protein
MTSCWQSGGPEWLFGAVLGSALTAIVAFGWWRTTRMTLIARGSTGSRAAAAGLCVVAVAAMSVVLGVWGCMFAAGATAVSWVTGEATLRQGIAVEGGVPLTGGWGAAYRTARLGAPVLVVLALVSAVGFGVAMVLLGSSCS